jgi:hypothetical protein
MMTGCAALTSLGYTGDGMLTDHGMLAYASRYLVDLGPINTSSPTSRTYHLSGLPHAEFVVGIQVTDPRPNSVDDDRSNRRGRVAVTLVDSEGETVIREDALLRHWDRSYALGGVRSTFYRVGATRELPLAGGGVKIEQVGMKPSGGWGSHFNSEPGERYTLNVRILEPFDDDAKDARVTLVGFDR